MRYLYQITGIRALCEIPFPVQTGAESADFFRLFSAGKYCGSEIYIPSDRGFGRCSTGRATGRLTGIILRLKEYSAFITALSGSFRHMPELPGWEIQVRQFYCDYVRGMESYMNHSHNLCDLLGLETLLLKYDGLAAAFFFHSLERGGRFFFFCALRHRKVYTGGFVGKI